MAWNDWTVVLAQLRAFLNDTAETKKWNDAALLDYTNWGLEDLVRYFPLVKCADFTDVDATTVDLPSDFYRPLVVEFPDGQFIEEIVLTPGTFLYSQGEVDTHSLPCAWYRDSTSIYLLRKPSATWRLHYEAYYPQLVDDTSSLSTPRWSVQALVYYAASIAVSSRSVKEAELNRWDRHTDSGRPVDNPLALEAQRLYNEYLRIVTSHEDDRESIQTWQSQQRRR